MLKKLTILLTLVILIGLYASIDRQALLSHFRQLNVPLFLLALCLFVPQSLVTAWRWCWMVADVLPLGLVESTRLILASKALNAFVPSKLGEMSKAYFLKRRSNVALSRGTALVLIEKVLDTGGLCATILVGVLWTPQKGRLEVTAALVALLFIAVMGLLFILKAKTLGRVLPDGWRLMNRLRALLADWDATLTSWKQHRLRLLGILALSCLLWFLHLIQIYLFFPILHSTVGIQTVFAYVPISIFIGLLPFTIGGMGTRDSALIFLFAPYESASVMAGVGLLCSLRYWMDTLMGLPFFHRYSLDRT
jgi:uncharacterized protein (TIRG00374 family)